MDRQALALTRLKMLEAESRRVVCNEATKLQLTHKLVMESHEGDDPRSLQDFLESIQLSDLVPDGCIYVIDASNYLSVHDPVFTLDAVEQDGAKFSLKASAHFHNPIKLLG